MYTPTVYPYHQCNVQYSILYLYVRGRKRSRERGQVKGDYGEAKEDRQGVEDRRGVGAVANATLLANGSPSRPSRYDDTLYLLFDHQKKMKYSVRKK